MDAKMESEANNKQDERQLRKTTITISSVANGFVVREDGYINGQMPKNENVFITKSLDEIPSIIRVILGP